MFDFAWTEIAMVAVVALIAIGPKDMPVAIRAVTNAIKKARRMAAEFQTHVDEMVKDANLDEVRNQINELRNFDIKGEVEKAVDPDGSLASTFASNPLDPANYGAGTALADPESPPEVTVAELAPEPAPDPELLAVPAFIPPEIARPPVPPAFIPPTVTLARTPRA
ncbi:MAG: twin arginine-targeting protein translocase TatB [Rhodospirillales bacterium 70-18]|nr:twin-arginine translocase subunit TatB [Rhodospirillales bacterium]OJY67322.1 MAG: twin arginine-targeting protein translocase TatB [Rhodospirillales bacterium 70-18]